MSTSTIALVRYRIRRTDPPLPATGCSVVGPWAPGGEVSASGHSSYRRSLPKDSVDVTTFRDGVRERLGEILVRKGRLSREQLNQAIAAAQASGDRLGTHLVKSRSPPRGGHRDRSRRPVRPSLRRHRRPSISSPELAAARARADARRLNVLPLSSVGRPCPPRDRRPERCLAHRRAPNGHGRRLRSRGGRPVSDQGRDRQGLRIAHDRGGTTRRSPGKRGRRRASSRRSMPRATPRARRPSRR